VAKIRVLVVEDSPTVRHRLREVLASDADLDVTAEATDGAQAVELCRSQRPDVITMDMMLPVMNGVAAIEHIMASWPTPILVVSSSSNRAELLHTYDALAAGAVDVLDKPHGDEPEGVWERQLLSAVKLVSRIRVITHPRARLNALTVTTSSGPAATTERNGRVCELVVIGASTGGPAAVVETLRALPRRYRIPVLLVQHIGAPFAASFTEWLGAQIGRPAFCPRDREPVSSAAGRVAVAPPERHLVVRDGLLRLLDQPERHSCRPSVDVLFESVATGYGRAAVGCLLSGMGQDGARGLLAMRRAGALTFAQNEETCVVYGMPRAAAELDAAVRLLPPDQIGRQLAGLVAAAGR
jgi:two-component system chemotaxis response regulator CheB